MRILKFAVPYTEGKVTNIDMPVGTQILSAGIQERTDPAMQWEEIVLWGLVDVRNAMKYAETTIVRQFYVVNTGESFNTPFAVKFIGTVTTKNGTVWHVLEVVR